jgi:glycosyltransferase involved in cell wall biosynthesis
MFQFFPGLESAGLELTVVPLLESWYLDHIYSAAAKFYWNRILKAFARRLLRVACITRYDLIWIQGEIFPWLPAFAEKILGHLKVPFIVDYDDAVFHRYDMHRLGIVRSLLGGKIDSVMRQASLVVVGNEYLAERAERAGAKAIKIIPTVVDCNHYHVTGKQNEAVFTIGWIGTPKTVSYLSCLANPLAKLAKQAHVRLVVVGAADFTLADVHVDCVPWQESLEVELIQDFDVGIMPLVDEAWERGKCGYKLIQYMACGKPVIATPVGVNSDLVKHGVNGFLARTCDEWFGALSQLEKDPSCRGSMGRIGRQLVEEKYSLQVATPALVACFNSVQANGLNSAKVRQQ